MEIILKQFIPLQNMNYFTTYFTTVENVEKSDWRVLRKFNTAFLLLICQTMHFFYQYFVFYFTPMNTFQQIMHGDYAGISNINSELYLFVNGLCYTSIYFFYLLYFPHKHNACLKLIRTILIERHDGFFTIPWYGKGKTPVCLYIRKFSLVVLNILQGFILIIHIFVVSTQIVSMVHLFNYDPNIYKSIEGVALILILEARLLLLHAAIYLYAHAHILLAVLWIICLKIYSIKLDQLATPPTTRQLGNISTYLNKFRLELTRTLLSLLDANQLFSKVIVVFLAVNCPLNCLLVCLLLMGRIPAEKIVFVGPVSLEGFVFIFGVHYTIAGVNKRIHAPSKQFIRLSLLTKYCQLRYRLRLDSFIHCYHTRKRYGFSYYSVGLISMMTFTKYILLYSELLMFVFKLEKKL